MNTNLSPMPPLSSSFITPNFQSHFCSQIVQTPLNLISISTQSPLIFSKINQKITRNTFTHHHFAGVQSSVLDNKFNQCHKAMAAHSSNSNDEFRPFQLNDMSDFVTVESKYGYITICGFGSLLSERSARSTFPELCNFRVARLKGFRRVFAHVAPIFFERGIAKPETKEISSLSVEPCEGEELIVSVFEITKSEVPSFMERELEFRFLAVQPETLNGWPYPTPAPRKETFSGWPFPIPAVLCTRYSDEEFFNVRCKGSKEVYHQHYGRYGIDKIWRDDILPCRIYLRHCVLAARNLGDATYNNFLDHTYLADRQTTIRQYLATTGAGIMEEEPPESLKARYGG